MNPNSREVGPVPGVEHQPNPEQDEIGEAQEASPSLPEKSPTTQSAPVIAVPQDLPQALDPVIPDDNSAAPPMAMGVTDQPTDMRPWVDKTKEVVASTKDDPFVQKREISKVKAEFIKSRFNKVIKAEDSA